VSGLSSGVVALAAGGFHTCALTSGGGVKCWGDNSYGQLGDDSNTERLEPVNVSGLTSGVVAIAAGNGHTCALTSGGGMKCWGYNGDGRLGDGTTTDRDTPVDVSGLTSGVASITADGWHTCAVTTGGAAKCWGDNTYGQLGDATQTDRRAPVGVSGLTSGVASISAGSWHTCAVTTGGAAKCWGDNAYGHIGDGSFEERHAPVAVTGLGSGVAAISGGVTHTCALTTGGGVMCWGEAGTLGNGTPGASSPVPVDVSGLTSGVAAMSAGYLHTLVVMDDGRAKAWGNAIEGQLGNGGLPNLANADTPIQVSSLYPGEVAQPDGLISNGVGFVGSNIYSTSTTNQTIAVNRAPGRSATFTVRVQNDGDARDKILVDGTPPPIGFTMVVTRNGVTVTKAFIAGTLGVALDPGTRQDLVIVITVKPTTLSGKIDRETVVLTSTNDVNGKDAVRARVTVI
jgi:hypothetical protein